MQASSTTKELPGMTRGVAGACALVVFTVAAVMLGRGASVDRGDATVGTPVASLAFRAEDQSDGSIALRAVPDGGVIATVQPGQDGFIRGTLRGLAQARQRAGLGGETPFLVTRYDTGKLVLDDAATGRHLTLDAFGQTNAMAFGRLLGSTATQ